jgi:ribose 5-phosphate isomerase B
MKVAIGCDHAGFILKYALTKLLEKLGHEIMDMGTNSSEAVDYPDFSAKVAEAISSGQASRGIILCGSGVGACITANKFRGVRAGICHDTYSAAQGVEHDDMNVLCLGARIVGQTLAETIVKSFLNVKFSSEERHLRRLNKIKAIEEENMK